MIKKKIATYNKKIKNYLNKIQKEPIKINVEKFQLIAPAEHKLESYLKWFKYYSRNLPRIAGYIESKYATYNIIDVGANIGDSIALLRSVGIRQPIYAIEAESSYYEMLLTNIKQFTHVRAFQCFLGQYTSEEKLVMHAEEGTGSAKSHPGVAKSIKVKKLDDFIEEQNLRDIKLLKIDTDGFDLKILRGGFDSIAKLKPVLFFEYDSAYLEEQKDDGIKIFDELAQIGYNRILYYDNYGKFLISITTGDTAIIKQLYAYITKKEGAFHYYDLCIFHKDDDDLAETVINKEIEFFNS
jgi:FkbM family methyltransferase